MPQYFIATMMSLSCVRRRFASQQMHMRMMSFLRARKRFFDKVDILQADEKYLIQLDGKTIKTPLLNQLHAPSRPLALALAQEWHQQLDDINPNNMPLTTICNTAIDNPTQVEKSVLVDAILGFLHTDTICCLTDEPETLKDLQDRKWTPIRRWFEKQFNVNLTATSDLFGSNQPTKTVQRLGVFLHDCNKWQLSGLQTSINAVKSFILPLAVIEGKLTVEEAVNLSQLELDFQIERWGNVEYAHDIDRRNTEILVAAGALVYQLTKAVS